MHKIMKVFYFCFFCNELLVCVVKLIYRLLFSERWQVHFLSGWTPLHAAACCGNVDLVEYLCAEGGDISITNSDKELAVDLAEEDDCRLALEEEHHRQGISPDECRNRYSYYLMISGLILRKKLFQHRRKINQHCKHYLLNPFTFVSGFVLYK